MVCIALNILAEMIYLFVLHILCMAVSLSSYNTGNEEKDLIVLLFNPQAGIQWKDTQNVCPRIKK